MDFLHSINAPQQATFTLIAEIVLGLGLLVGALFARRGQYRLHKYWQSSIVLLNLLLIAGIMIPSFSRSVAPLLPSSLGVQDYAVVAIHGALGLTVELLALYLVLAAGTNLLPRRWRITHYKLSMRSTLALWWVVILLGTATYYSWYATASPSAAAGPTGSSTAVTLRNFVFQTKTITVAAGTTVAWRDVQGLHTVHSDRGGFRSSPLNPGRTFDHTFRRAGVYPYHCDFHGGPGGAGMSGRIVVVARSRS